MKVYDISGKPDNPYAEGYDACARDLYEMTTNMLLKKGPMPSTDQQHAIARLTLVY